MRYQGRIADWNDDKGFGFVAPNGGGARAFVHIKAFVRGGRRPADGDLIVYETRADGSGRLRAERVHFAGEPPTQAKPGKRTVQATGIGAAYLVLFCIALGVLVAMGRLAPLAPFAYAIVSLFTFIAYAFDKSAALKNRWRTPESTLLLLGLACGWPGALIAQKVFRHKSRKDAFQTAFWLTVILNTAVLTWSVSPSGVLFFGGLMAH